MKTSLGLRLGQQLAMTPALQQAIKLLQMSSLDLQTEIQDALEGNLMLEQIDDSEPTVTDEALATSDSPAESPPEPENSNAESVEVERGDLDGEWMDQYDGAVHRDAGSSADWQEYRQANMQASRSLRDHLVWQAQMGDFDGDQATIAAYLIDAIDDDGFLIDPDTLLGELADEFTADAVEAALARVQAFDPAGVAARSVPECLLLQLDQYNAGPVVDLARRIITEQFENLGRGARPQIAAALREPPDEIDEAVDLIQSLQPHPGEPYKDDDDSYVTPDVVVSRREGKWSVALNPEIAPRVRINSHYQSLIKRADRSEEQSILKQHLQEARFFINSLRSRNETLMEVAESIVAEQRAFLEYGPEAMRPLVLRDIAERLGIHESTVSRATSGKYMLTPRGLYELKYFFSSHVRTTEGGTCSATAIQAMIRRLVNGESANKPLSDQAIADALLSDGVQVARRTVAKYREALGVAPAHARRQR